MTEALLYIDGPIVSQIPCGEDGFALPGPFALLTGLQQQLDWQRPYDAVRVQINSPGGETTQGFAMGDWLRSLSVPVTTVAIGQCSSIATAPFLAGDTRLIHENTEMLIHLPSGGFKGTGAAAAQAFANEMADCEQKLLDMYVSRAGVDPVEVAALMAAETTLTSEQALSMGFATGTIQPITALAILPKVSSNPKPADPAPSIMQSIRDFFKGMKTALADLEASVDVKKALDVTTAGENPTTLHIDTGDRASYETGDKVYTDAEMTTAAADADFVLSDGNTITVKDGAISAIAEPTTDKAPKVEGELAEALKAIADGMTALATEVKGLKTNTAANTKEVGALKTNYATLARSVKTNAGNAPDAAPANADADDDQDPATVAAARRAERRSKRFKTE